MASADLDETQAGVGGCYFLERSIHHRVLQCHHDDVKTLSRKLERQGLANACATSWNSLWPIPPLIERWLRSKRTRAAASDERPLGIVPPPQILCLVVHSIDPLQEQVRAHGKHQHGNAQPSRQRPNKAKHGLKQSHGAEVIARGQSSARRDAINHAGPKICWLYFELRCSAG